MWEAEPELARVARRHFRLASRTHVLEDMAIRMEQTVLACQVRDGMIASSEDPPRKCPFGTRLLRSPPPACSIDGWLRLPEDAPLPIHALMTASHNNMQPCLLSELQGSVGSCQHRILIGAVCCWVRRGLPIRWTYQTLTSVDKKLITLPPDSYCYST